MGHQERWDPERRDPVRRPHEWRCVEDGGQRDGIDQVQRAYDVEQPDQSHGASCSSGDRWDSNKRQHGCQEISESRRIGKLWRDAGIDRTWREEHQTEMPQRMQQKDRQQNSPRLVLVELGRR